MPTDSYYRIGYSHTVCQDYTVHTNDTVILSDGCSSAPNSDIGARILVHRMLESLKKDMVFNVDLIGSSQFVIETLGLSNDSLCATLLMIDKSKDFINTYMVGDGTIVSRKRNSGELEIFNLKFLSGAPVYLRYILDNTFNEYMSKFGDKYSINGITQDNGYFTDYEDWIVHKNFLVEDYDLVAVFSDGLDSFQRKEGTSWTNFPSESVLKELLNIKSFAGSFVQRRCNKAFTKFHSEGIYNMDDFSMGVIKC